LEQGVHPQLSLRGSYPISRALPPSPSASLKIFIYTDSSTSDEIYDNYYTFYKEREVTVADDIGSRAKYMEVHFYPDGSVKAAVTASASPPRLLLSKERKDKSKYPRCPNDKKPE
jgi:hypothetical protein